MERVGRLLDRAGAPAFGYGQAQCPLRFVRDDTTIVLGLVTTKTPRRETPDELAARVREASRLVGLDRLAIGTQCGFSTSVIGNAITPHDQRRKLATLVHTADSLWG